jgi:hypothetical protein
VVEGYLGAGLVSDVEYVGKEPNRATVTFNKLATRNAERIELFSNSRESETKKDGSFYAAECLRQVSERLPHRPREDGPTHPADHFKIQSCFRLGSSIEVAAFQNPSF